MFRYNEKQIKFANCNGVQIEVRKFWSRSESEDDAYFLVTILDAFDDWSEPDDYEAETEAEALEMFAGFVEEYRDKPNWNAQATYDVEHGTINGEDAGIVQMRELLGD